MGPTEKIYFVMGVSGSGKTTLGQVLAGHLGIPFFDGDDFHPPENIQKMAAGIPLEDADRRGWLLRLSELATHHKGTGAVIACSALKERYRGLLMSGLQAEVCWIYLHGSHEQIYKRMQKRKAHFMPADMLRSQFETLEPPSYGIHIPVELGTEEAVERILDERKDK
jgi:carbohydrate kinase (thermoresistant glucokinase family)